MRSGATVSQNIASPNTPAAMTASSSQPHGGTTPSPMPTGGPTPLVPCRPYALPALCAVALSPLRAAAPLALRPWFDAPPVLCAPVRCPAGLCAPVATPTGEERRSEVHGEENGSSRTLPPVPTPCAGETKVTRIEESSLEEAK
jgi:hypothetical protein